MDSRASPIPQSIAGAPTALHRGAEELPFVEYQEGVTFQLRYRQ